MSSGRKGVSRHHACAGKRQHESLASAEAAIDFLRQKRDEPIRRAKRLNAYLCINCGWFHIGHRRLLPKGTVGV